MADDPKHDVDALRRVDEDEPFRLTPDLPPEVASPLAPFKGAVPPAPAWFADALAHAPERSFVPVDGANIELLAWGDRGKPGLIFVHGNSAHADWWSFIAPFFAEHYRVAALSLSGMGASDWRERYSFDLFSEEIFACAKAAGLYEAAVKPVYIGHSFGGAQVLHSAARHGERMRACILVDTGFGGPPTPEEFEKMQAAARARGENVSGWGARMSQRSGRNRIYPTLEAALTRFRFMPPQIPGNLYIADFIARHSLKRVAMAEGEGGGEGWTWRFDPGLWSKLDRTGMTAIDPATVVTPLVHIYGDRSEIIRRHGFQGPQGRLLMTSVPTIVIPDSEHHIMVDQPLALVAALRSLLAVWAR
jgi:pimeloyl-ACP methyl ester carboxylesterase